MRTLSAVWPLLLVPVMIRAQTELRPGVRIRVEAPGIVAGRVVGTLISQTADSIVVGSPELAPLTLPVSHISSLEIGHGSSRAGGAWRGARWGAGIGAVGGMLIMNSIRACDIDTKYPCTSTQGRERADGGQRTQFAIAAAGAGAVYGALIGLLIPTEDWDVFDLKLRPVVTGSSPSLGFSLRF